MESAPRKRSQLVSVLAWVSIAGSGMGVMIGIAQVLLWDLIFAKAFDSIRDDPEAFDQVPTHFQFMLENPKGWMGAMSAFALLALGASIGVLVRQHWGRLAYMGVMGLAMLATLATVPLIFERPVGWDDQAMPEGFNNFLLVSQGINLVYTLGAVALYALVIWKLATPPIRDEFS